MELVYITSLTMTATTIKILEDLTADQFEEIINLLLAAYVEDPCSQAMTGGDKSLEPLLFRAMLGAGALEGTIYVVARDEDDKILSVGMWFGPGTQMMNSEAQRAAGWDHFMRSVSEECRNWWLTTMQKDHRDVINSLLGDKYKDSWWANQIATHPDYQCQGHGSALIRTVFDRARTEKKIVALVTQTKENCDWYSSLGFKCILADSLPIAGSDSRLPRFIMKWDPEHDA
ncbi:hypothetical protein C8J56DRAFT_949945 [Mycena floridula]|nr:hypothetical protein C8J56DRAFT_949945 [Mycena floridula]